jgi:hypothetical protein
MDTHATLGVIALSDNRHEMTDALIALHVWVLGGGFVPAGYGIALERAVEAGFRYARTVLDDCDRFDRTDPRTTPCARYESC